MLPKREACYRFGRNHKHKPKSNLHSLLKYKTNSETNSNPSFINYITFKGDFLSDFTFTSSATIPLVAEIVYDDTSLELCTLMCVSADGFNCKTIDYCPETKKCLLHSENVKQPSTTSSQTDLCYNYKSMRQNNKLVFILFISIN